MTPHPVQGTPADLGTPVAPESPVGPDSPVAVGAVSQAAAAVVGDVRSLPRVGSYVQVRHGDGSEPGHGDT